MIEKENKKGNILKGMTGTSDSHIQQQKTQP